MKTLLLLVFGLATGSALAHPASEHSAKAEFFELKAQGDWVDYSAQSYYVAVEGTDFIGFESARNEARTCLFGIRLGDVTPGTYDVRTRFFCFDTDYFNLRVLAQACLGEEKCHPTDPAAISVGIGNIREKEEKILTSSAGPVVPSVIGGGKYPFRKSVIVTGTPSLSVHDQIENIMNGENP